MSAPQRVAALVGLALALILGTSSLAQADGTEQMVRGQHLELISEVISGARMLSPGTTVRWAVRVAAPEAEDGAIERSLVVDGALASSVRVSVDGCSVRPSETCSSRHPLVVEHTPTPGSAIDLGVQDAREATWLLVRVTLDDDAPDAVQGLSGSLRLVADGVGDRVTVTPGDGSAGSESASDGPDGTTGNEATVDDRADRGPGGSGYAEAPGGSTRDDPEEAQAPPEEPSTAGGVIDRLAATGTELLPWLLVVLTIVVIGGLLRARGRARGSSTEEDDERSGT